MSTHFQIQSNQTEKCPPGRTNKNAFNSISEILLCVDGIYKMKKMVIIVFPSGCYNNSGERPHDETQI